MKAALTPNYGPANILEVKEVAIPTVGANDVLIETHATPVTAGDRRLRAADFPSISKVPGRLMMGVFKPRNPIQGTMFAGRIVAVGEEVTEYKVGDDVFGSVDNGTYAQYVVAKADGPIAKIPAGISFAEAADVPYGAVTALRFLKDMAQVKAGERVLILGASGGVGRYAVQIAKHLGAHVTGVASHRNEELVRSLGADEFIDYRQCDWRNSQAEYDVIFDIADTTNFAEAKPRLTETGRYMSLFISVNVLVNAIRTSFGNGKKAMFGVALGTAADMAILCDWLAQGVIRPTVGEQFSLDDIASAHVAAETNASATAMVCVANSAQIRLAA